MNIGVLLYGFNWNGGWDFVRYLIESIAFGEETTNFKLITFLPKGMNISNLINCSADLQNRQIGFVEFQNGEELRKLVINHSISVLLPVNGVLEKNFPVPWVGYLFDFQHRYMPQYFSVDECYSREIEFAKRLRHSQNILVNSCEVKKDVGKFYPWENCDKIHSIPYAPFVNKDWLEPKSSKIDKYKLPKKYFVISNQFWIHKGHMTALKAFKIFSDQSESIHLVCTGLAEDYRHPDYITKLKAYIVENGLLDKVHIVGLIPKEDQIEILKNSIALIQPSEFEGGPGGGCVYDAISLGVPVILGNIPTSSDVTGRNLKLFEINNSNDLCNKMFEMINSQLTRPTRIELLEMGVNHRNKVSSFLSKMINNLV